VTRLRPARCLPWRYPSSISRRIHAPWEKIVAKRGGMPSKHASKCLPTLPLCARVATTSSFKKQPFDLLFRYIFPASLRVGADVSALESEARVTANQSALPAGPFFR
jgi:hypothetical protein